MKKVLVCFALFAALIFATGCGSSSKNNNQNDNSDTGDTVTDGDVDPGDSGSADTDPSDSGHENPDTTPEQPDNGDSQPDNGDSAPDNGDSAPDSDNDSGDSAPDSDETAPANDNPDNLPECSPESATPCIDSETGLIWSGKSAEKMHWADAIDYCKNINEGGFSDWRLPSIAVLETLVRNCDNSNGCTGDSSGKYSKFGDIVFFWSSSSGNAEATTAYGVYFYNGARQTKNVDENFDARCVRRENETRKANCGEIPEHTEYNTVSEITQTWDWDQMWVPTLTPSYSESPSTSRCTFKCEENYYWYPDLSTSGCIDHYISECAKEDIAITTQDAQDSTPEEIQEYITTLQENQEALCPHGDLQKKERLDASGNYCIENECTINPNEIVPDGTTAWIDNLPKLAFTDVPVIPDYNITYYKKTEHLNKAGLTDLTIKKSLMTMYVKDVPTASCFAPSNIVENASTNTMIVGETCHSGGQSISPSGIVAKNAQPKFTDTEFGKACAKVPNSEHSLYYNQCYTTITEFAWLENVIPYLHSKAFAQRSLTPLKTTKIEKNWDNNTFYVYLSADDKHKWVVELPNAKRCLDECYGKEGCTVSIEPSADISNGCVVEEAGN